MDINEIAAYAPQIAKVECGTEPTLREILVWYYEDHNFSPKEASNTADEYFRALATRFDLGV